MIFIDKHIQPFNVAKAHNGITNRREDWQLTSSLVNDIATVEMENGIIKKFYSFPQSIVVGINHWIIDLR